MHVGQFRSRGNSLQASFQVYLIRTELNWYGMVWYGMVDVCDGYLAAEAAGSSFG